MGRKDVTVYTCDGCKASSTVERGDAAPGFRRLTTPRGEVWLCAVCWAAVDWVIRFQGITIPSKVYKANGRYRLRKEVV